MYSYISKKYLKEILQDFLHALNSVWQSFLYHLCMECLPSAF